MSEIKITTEELWNEARSLSAIAVDIGRISVKNSTAINKMEESCSFMTVAGIYAGANQLISRFSTLMQSLTRVATKAMNCAQAYEESNEELKKEFEDWFESVQVNTVNGIPEREYWDSMVGQQYVNYNDDPLGLYRSRINENSSNGWTAKDKMQCVGYAWARFQYLTGQSPSFSCGFAKFIGTKYNQNILELVNSIEHVKIPALAYHSRGSTGHVVCIEKIILSPEGKHIVYYTAANEEAGKPDGTLFSFVFEDEPGKFEGFVQLK